MSDQLNSRTARRKKLEQERAKNKKTKKPQKATSWIKKIVLTIFLIGLAGLLGGFGLFAYYASSAPALDENLLKDPLTSDFLDVDGNVFMKFGAEKREFVPYNEIPKLMEDAILATEDVRFYKHHGMDFWRLGGAVLANVRGGFGSQGASTLTQQVIKNSFLTDEKTLKRKAQEAWLAFKLEREYSKEEIFEMYFNKILMSGNRYGFGTGAKYFYGKNLDELDLQEVATLAGLPQYPNGYNPFLHPERAEKRRNIVLGLMYQHKKITKEQMEAAKAIPVTTTLLSEAEREENNSSKYPAYVAYVLDELEAADLTHLLSEGIKIQTNLDPKAQQSVENALNTSELYESEEMQAGMTVVDTKTGAIVAIGGGRNYSGHNWNFASNQKRQPGSVIKPILSYGPMIENNSWSTGTTIVDEPYNYKGTNRAIRNVDGRYLGKMTVREALYKSRNIPAVKVFEEVGVSKAGAFADGLGLHYNTNKLYSSDALGGGEHNFSTVEMAGAYAAFGNGGIYTKPHAVKKIVFRDGKTERSLAPKPVVAMKESTAYMITDILRDVLTSGTGQRANVSGLDIAGKTGTTNYPSEIIQKNGFKSTYVPDSWFAGYTTNYTIAVWGGYEKYTTPIKTYDYGRYVPQNLFKMVMRDISSGKDTARFKKPSSVEEATILYGSQPLILASNSTPSNLRRTELFVRGTVPVEMAKEEVIEIAAPTDLAAQYDVATNSISLSWAHNAPDPELYEGPVQFTVAVGVDGGGMQELTTTGEHFVTFSGVEMGRTYTFSVVARAGELVSKPASTSLKLDGGQEEDPGNADEDNEPEVPNDENNNGQNGNGWNNGNNNNGNNGNNGNWNNGNNGNNGNGNWNNGNNGNNGNNNDTNKQPPQEDSTQNDSGGNTETNESSDEIAQ
ncbi:PBP1A family penicillin-binding protein [Sporosarcina sp. HYO08]|uniref:PBP1A family penicillin-binding protein n=1 Tax=Sporosarcina sp. HYO08 TaxID=1759557 RepID=UPI00079CCDC5|nr:PBP1A family penicillin-binding protein [Sporosarcina sp. HYO08]KXH81989.1 hypothetical protein AU377_06970 [Sporosarcina sp. HYO08]